MEHNNIPAEYRPISMWGYFGYQLLFSIPVVGFILLIICSFSRNINKRNFARSYFCYTIICFTVFAVALAIAMAVLLATGLAAQAINFLTSL